MVLPTSLFPIITHRCYFKTWSSQGDSLYHEIHLVHENTSIRGHLLDSTTLSCGTESKMLNYSKTGRGETYPQKTLTTSLLVLAFEKNYQAMDCQATACHSFVTDVVNVPKKPQAKTETKLAISDRYETPGQIEHEWRWKLSSVI